MFNKRAPENPGRAPFNIQATDKPDWSKVGENARVGL